MHFQASIAPQTYRLPAFLWSPDPSFHLCPRFLHFPFFSLLSFRLDHNRGDLDRWLLLCHRSPPSDIEGKIGWCIVVHIMKLLRDWSPIWSGRSLVSQQRKRLLSVQTTDCSGQCMSKRGSYIFSRCRRGQKSLGCCPSLTSIKKRQA